MNILCSKENLIKATNIAVRAISSKTTIPILECLLLVADTTFKIRSTDTELSIETSTIEAEILSPGNIAVNAKIFSDIVRKLPENESIIIKVEDDQKIYIKSGKVEFKLMGQTASDFPELPNFEKEQKYLIAGDILKKMIRQTNFSVAKSDDKPALTGGFLEVENNNIKIVTVDNFRVSYREEPLLDAAVDVSAIIPGKTLNELSKVLGEQEVEIYFGDKHVLFDFAEGIFITKTIDAEFIRYKQILSQNTTINFTATQKDVLETLERAVLISSDTRKNPVKFKIEKEKFIVTSTGEIGNFYDEIDIDMSGEKLEISFNPQYILDAVRAIDIENLSFNFSTNLSPVIIKGTDTENSKYLVLPLRLT